MKKTLLILVASVFAISVSAQWFSIGIKAGYNTSLGFDDEWNFGGADMNFKNDISNGFHAGLFARFGRALYLQPEVLYNYSVYDQSVGIADISVKRIKASTIDVPVLLGWSIVNMKSFKFRLMAGPKFSFNAGSTNADGFWDGMTANAKKARIGLDAGIGFDIWRIIIDLRYNLMGNLYSFEDGNTSDKINVSPKNSFALSVGFRFGNNMKK